MAYSHAPTTERLRARRGLWLFGALTLAGTASFQAALFSRGTPIEQQPLLVLGLMWTPGVASIVTRLVLREGFADVSFRWGGRETWRGVGLVYAYPLVVGAAAYGAAWAAGLAHFSPPPVAMLGLAHAPAVVRFAALAGLGVTMVTVIGLISATGEELGWRGYLLTRLVDAGVRRPVLVSGVVWGLWHCPLILSGQYASGPWPWLSAPLFLCSIVGASYVFGLVRLRSGSVWPAAIGHGAWNAIIQGVFDSSTKEPGVWLGESGVLVVTASVTFALLTVRAHADVPLLRTPRGDGAGRRAAAAL